MERVPQSCRDGKASVTPHHPGCGRKPTRTRSALGTQRTGSPLARSRRKARPHRCTCSQSQPACNAPPTQYAPPPTNAPQANASHTCIQPAHCSIPPAAGYAAHATVTAPRNNTATQTRPPSSKMVSGDSGTSLATHTASSSTSLHTLRYTIVLESGSPASSRCGHSTHSKPHEQRQQQAPYRVHGNEVIDEAHELGDLRPPHADNTARQVAREGLASSLERPHLLRLPARVQPFEGANGEAIRLVKCIVIIALIEAAQKPAHTQRKVICHCGAAPQPISLHTWLPAGCMPGHLIDI